MIKTDLIKAVQENYTTKKNQKRAMEYSKHIAKKNTWKNIAIVLVIIAWIVLVGFVGSVEIGRL